MKLLALFRQFFGFSVSFLLVFGFIKVDRGPLQDVIAFYGHFKRYIYCYSNHKHGNLY